MKIALICPAYEEQLASIDAMVTRYFHSRELTKALSERIGETTWVQAYREEGTHQIGSAQLQLVAAKPFEGGVKGVMSEHVDAISLTKVINIIKPDLVHITGLLPMDILRISEICSVHTTKLTASFHGGSPSEDPAFYALQLRALKKLSGILFNAPERPNIWKDAGLLDASTRLAICPETSSYFIWKNRDQVRQLTQMFGDPVCVATSRLHSIKDPITLLKGFAKILKVMPEARLYWVFQTEELLPEVKEMLNENRQLQDAVVLLGSLEFNDMEDLFNSADFFLQASLDEIGGNSLVEAMACGAVPVVTNIPSFRYLTGNNRFGTLFEIGDSEGLARIVTEFPKQEYTKYSKQVRGYFDEFLSFDTIARAIQEIIAK